MNHRLLHSIQAKKMYCPGMLVISRFCSRAIPGITMFPFNSYTIWHIWIQVHFLDKFVGNCYAQYSSTTKMSNSIHSKHQKQMLLNEESESGNEIWMLVSGHYHKLLKVNDDLIWFEKFTCLRFSYTLRYILLLLLLQ